MIGDEAHRVNGFPGGSCGDQNVLACQILLTGDMAENVLQQHLLLRHSAVAGVAVGQHPPIRRHDLIAKPLQFFQIVLHDGVVEHIVVHSGETIFLQGQAITVVVSISSAIPLAILPITLPEAGAIITTSARFASATCSTLY